MPKMDIASFVFLAIWPGLPLVLIFWGYMNAREAGQLIESLQETTSGTITQSFSYAGGEQDNEGDVNYFSKLAIRFDYEVGGKTYTSGIYAPENIVPSSERGPSFDEIAAKYVEGESYPVWYDTDNPSKAYLVKGSMWDHAGKMKWGIYILIGVGGLLTMVLVLSKFS